MYYSILLVYDWMNRELKPLFVIKRTKSIEWTDRTNEWRIFGVKPDVMAWDEAETASRCTEKSSILGQPETRPRSGVCQTKVH